MPDRQILPLDEAGLAQWRGNIEKARQSRQTASKWWDANLKKYAPDVNGNPDEYGGELNTNRDFTLVERKKADLFYQRPDVQAVPSPLMKDFAALMDTHTSILNEKLGLDGVNAKSLVHQVLFDVLCTSGTGWTAMGYESVTVPTPTINQATGLEEIADVPLFEDCYWMHLSPMQGLKPHDFRSTRWDDAPWLGYDFEAPLRPSKRKGWVPEDFEGTSPSTETRFQNGSLNTVGDSVVKGTLIYYKSSLYRDDIVHPQHQTLLILIDGVDTPAEHKDSPLQTLNAQGGLEPNSLIGFPIHPLTIRSLTDSSDVPSDCTISRPTVNELNKFRGQMVEQRDTQIIAGFYDGGIMPVEALAKLVRSRTNGLIGLPSEVFAQERPIKPLERGPYPRENFTVNDYLDNDLARTHALDSNAQGVQGADQTATEATIQQGNVNARLGFERGNVLDWYIKGVTKYSTIIQRFMPVQQAAQIVGPEAAQEWDGWRKTVPATLAFTALPDSALRTDLASERKRALDEYQFFRNDTLINPAELLRVLLPRLHWPASVLNQTPPEKGPEPTRPGLTLKGDDLNPLMPQFPILIEVLGQCGIKISPQAIQRAQEAAQTQIMMQQLAVAKADAQAGAGADTSHGGKTPAAEGLSKHHADLTGNLPGAGSAQPSEGMGM